MAYPPDRVLVEETENEEGKYLLHSAVSRQVDEWLDSFTVPLFKEYEESIDDASVTASVTAPKRAPCKPRGKLRTRKLYKLRSPNRSPSLSSSGSYSAFFSHRERARVTFPGVPPNIEMRESVGSGEEQRAARNLRPVRERDGLSKRLAAVLDELTELRAELKSQRIQIQSFTAMLKNQAYDKFMLEKPVSAKSSTKMVTTRDKLRNRMDRLRHLKRIREWNRKHLKHLEAQIRLY